MVVGVQPTAKPFGLLTRADPLVPAMLAFWTHPHSLPHMAGLHEGLSVIQPQTCLVCSCPCLLSLFLRSLGRARSLFYVPSGPSDHTHWSRKRGEVRWRERAWTEEDKIPFIRYRQAGNTCILYSFIPLLYALCIYLWMAVTVNFI